jgi:small Trp-rich protein
LRYIRQVAPSLRWPVLPAGRLLLIMFFVLIGVVLIVCNLAGWGPMAEWKWDSFGDLMKLSAPFVLAALWWTFADGSGLTKRRAMERDEQRKQDRRDRNIDAMGLGHLHRHRDGKPRQKSRH